jgi:hypothetical protein
MVSPSSQPAALPDTVRSWVVYGNAKTDMLKVQREVDTLFTGFSFYPEIDWPQYGYRPPEGYPVLGAWRHPKTRVFAFLLDNPRMVSVEPSIQLLIYVAGDAGEITRLEACLAALKANFALDDRKTRVGSAAGERLTRASEARYVGVLTGVLTLFTAMVNGFSLYLRQLPPPTIGNPAVAFAYASTILLVHVAALLLLLLAVVTIAIFLVKYLMLLMRGL